MDVMAGRALKLIVLEHNLLDGPTAGKPAGADGNVFACGIPETAIGRCQSRVIGERDGVVVGQIRSQV
jgi:hypothetical protein